MNLNEVNQIILESDNHGEFIGIYSHKNLNLTNIASDFIYESYNFRCFPIEKNDVYILKTLYELKIPFFIYGRKITNYIYFDGNSFHENENEYISNDIINSMLTKITIEQVNSFKLFMSL